MNDVHIHCNDFIINFAKKKRNIHKSRNVNWYIKVRLRDWDLQLYAKKLLEQAVICHTTIVVSLCFSVRCNVCFAYL